MSDNLTFCYKPYDPRRNDGSVECLLEPQRPPLEFTQDGKNTKRRQYAPAELDKLAVIRELMDKGFSPGTIPPNIDELWKEINAAGNQGNYLKQINGKYTEHLP